MDRTEGGVEYTTPLNAGRSRFQETVLDAVRGMLSRRAKGAPPLLRSTRHVLDRDYPPARPLEGCFWDAIRGDVRDDEIELAIAEIAGELRAMAKAARITARLCSHLAWVEETKIQGATDLAQITHHKQQSLGTNTEARRWTKLHIHGLERYDLALHVDYTRLQQPVWVVGAR